MTTSSTTIFVTDYKYDYLTNYMICSHFASQYCWRERFENITGVGITSQVQSHDVMPGKVKYHGHP